MCTQEMHKHGCTSTLGGALWLVVHDAAVGVQGERKVVVRSLHDVVEGRKADHHSGTQHRGLSEQISEPMNVGIGLQQAFVWQGGVGFLFLPRSSDGTCKRQHAPS